MNLNINEMRNKLNEMTLNKNESYLIVKELSNEINLKLENGFKLFQIYKVLGLSISFNTFKKYLELASIENQNNKTTQTTDINSNVNINAFDKIFKTALIQVSSERDVHNFITYQNTLTSIQKQALTNALNKVSDNVKKGELYNKLLQAAS